MYPGNFLRLVIAGRGDGDERFSYGLSLQTFDQSPDEPNVDVVPEAVISAIRTFHGAVSSPRAVIDSVKLNEIGPDGRYVRPTTVETLLTGSNEIPGGQSSRYPAQVSLAVTLRTDVTRGLANRGRFFIPYPGLPMDPNSGLMTTAITNAAAAAAGTFLDALNAAGNWDVCVASDVGTGAFRKVLSVQVGQRFDVIRSRGRSLPETYSTDVLAAT